MFRTVYCSRSCALDFFTPWIHNGWAFHTRIRIAHKLATLNMHWNELRTYSCFIFNFIIENWMLDGACNGRNKNEKRVTKSFQVAPLCEAKACACAFFQLLRHYLHVCQKCEHQTLPIAPVICFFFLQSATCNRVKYSAGTYNLRDEVHIYVNLDIFDMWIASSAGLL